MVAFLVALAVMAVYVIAEFVIYKCKCKGYDIGYEKAMEEMAEQLNDEDDKIVWIIIG